MTVRRGSRLVALVAGLALLATACSDDDEPSSTDSTSTLEGPATTMTVAGEEPSTRAGTAEPASVETAATTAAPFVEEDGSAGEPAMTLTVDLHPDAVWEDGSPITVADLECTWQAGLNTPGSIVAAGYRQISSVEPGSSDKQAIISFPVAYGPYKTLFNPIIKRAAVADCMDVSGEFARELPISGRPVMLQSWSETESVLVANPNYWGDDTMVTERVVVVPRPGTEAEVAAIKAGEVDYIHPQFSDALGTALLEPTIELDVQRGGDYEAIYFQQLDGPLADDAFRAAFSKSIDREALFEQIYEPIFAAAGAEGELLDCGPIVEGPYCPDGIFQDTYDPRGAEQILTEAGWVRGPSGMWAKDGVVPEIRWMVNAGDRRRENAQDSLIPLLADAGFDVVADNCEARCVFQQRLPALDYDMAMYLATAPPDPTYLVPYFTCDNIPSPQNNNQGQNQQGWCNEEASAALHEADVTADQGDREALVERALGAMEADAVLLPLVNYPTAAAWRNDRLAGPVDAHTANVRAFANFHRWEDADGDGQIVIGAEQWPGCLNPITACANSSWYLWTVANPTLPGIWDTTNEHTFEITNLVAEEPVVEVR